MNDGPPRVSSVVLVVIWCPSSAETAVRVSRTTPLVLSQFRIRTDPGAARLAVGVPDIRDLGSDDDGRELRGSAEWETLPIPRPRAPGKTVGHENSASAGRRARRRGGGRHGLGRDRRRPYRHRPVRPGDPAGRTGPAGTRHRAAGGPG